MIASTHVPSTGAASSPESVDTVHEPVTQRRARNRNLQWLRGVAALFVLLYHASTYINFTFKDDRFAKVFNHEFGLIGVAIFFAISGALMAEILKTTAPGPFIIHRVLRIYPIFILAAIVLPFAFGLDAGVDSRALSLVPVGTNANYRLAVEWTLVFEVFFYVVLFLIAVAGWTRHLNAIAVVWLMLAVGGALFAPEQQARLVLWIYEMPFVAASAAFAGGLLIPSLARRHTFQPALAAVAVALSAIAAQADGLGVPRLFASAAAVVLVGLAMSPEFRGERDTVFTRIATKLGDWSYALYLCHVPVIMGMHTYLPFGPVAMWFATVIGALLLAIPLGMLDIRLYAWLRKRSDRSTPESFRRWAWIYVGVYLAIAFVFLFKD
ncbi:acyltransferase [Aureimonas sp. SK2]|uniref:acyltransferase family protein n=1 Tax=Aureimonas sp. SK2 TaxID=3015992 RepID=UPI002444F9EB|nr:acyltransferase [Aureimonas sp. SK2]